MTIFRIRRFSILVAFLFSAASLPARESFIPDTGAVAIHQRCRDVSGNMSVLSVSLRPGDEDFATLAYLRLHRGAQVISAYVTNGETGESDQADLFPFDLAVTRRQEAIAALDMLESEALFMNFPDIAAAQNADEVAARWSADSMTVHFMRLIGQAKPDLILLAGGDEPVNPWTIQAVRENLLSAVRKLASRGGDRTIMKELGVTPWDVGRVALRTNLKTGLHVPSESVNPDLKSSYADIGTMVSSRYTSLAVQRRMRNNPDSAHYGQIFPATALKVSELDAALPRRVPPSLAPIERRIRAAVEKISERTAARKIDVRLLVPILRDIDRDIDLSVAMPPRESRCILNWKKNLEKLRTAILGVTVRWGLNYTILTERQLVEFRIDSVAGLPPGGQSVVVFPIAKQDWIVNETRRTEFPLTTKESYRLVTPAKVEYDLPAAQYAQKRPTTAASISIVLVHRGTKDEDNFTYRMTPRIQYAPRFTAEVLTPIVRCTDGEQLVVRLTNHSRDGVSDMLRIADSICYSNVIKVALPTKEAFVRDTLRLTWYKNLSDRTYRVPVEYGRIKVSQFLGRKLSVDVQSDGEVGVCSGRGNSQLVTALGRLGITTVLVTPSAIRDAAVPGKIRTLIIDRRALTLQNIGPEDRSALKAYADAGGHLVILAQDAAVWNDDPLLSGVRLTPSTQLTENMPVRIDTTSALLVSPNKISEADFNGWLIERAYNIIESAGGSVECPVVSENGHPLMLSVNTGKGRIVYVDLALGPQLMNLHAGSMRVLANLVSW